MPAKKHVIVKSQNRILQLLTILTLVVLLADLSYSSLHNNRSFNSTLISEVDSECETQSDGNEAFSAISHVSFAIKLFNLGAFEKFGQFTLSIFSEGFFSSFGQEVKPYLVLCTIRI